MTEAQRTSATLKKVKTRWPHAFIYKINDRVRAGVPDSVIVLNGHTVWVEFKVLTSTAQSLHSVVTEIQKMTMRSLLKVQAEVLVACYLPTGEERIYAPSITEGGLLTFTLTHWPSLVRYLESELTCPSH